MSYPRDLDKYSYLELKEEIQRRDVARERGLCEYCERPVGTLTCKYPGLHRFAKEPLSVK